MQPRIACCVAAAALALAATAHVAAADPRVGIEMGRTLSGYPGLGARVDLGPVQVEGLIAGRLLGNEHEPQQIMGTVRALVPIRRWADGWVGVMAGAGARQRRPDPGFPNGAWSIEGGLHAEWFALPALSFGLDVGAVTGHRDGNGNIDRSTTLGAGTISGGGTLTFWF